MSLTIGRIAVSLMLYHYGHCFGTKFFLGPARPSNWMLCRANSTASAAAPGAGTQIWQIRQGFSPVGTAGKPAKATREIVLQSIVSHWKS
jgi:hypothetical protein